MSQAKEATKQSSHVKRKIDARAKVLPAPISPARPYAFINPCRLRFGRPPAFCFINYITRAFCLACPTVSSLLSQTLKPLETALEAQFATGRLYAQITSRPGQCGRCDGCARIQPCGSAVSANKQFGRVLRATTPRPGVCKHRGAEQGAGQWWRQESLLGWEDVLMRGKLLRLLEWRRKRSPSLA